MKLITIIYKSLVALRNYLYDINVFSSYQSSIPVISVGNITVGGTGKTPFVIYISNFLKEKNINPLIITRGYKRSSRKQIHITENSAPRLSEIGDEAALLHESCRGVDILVNKNRVGAVKWVEQNYSKYDCIILDDGFQHRSLKRDCNIALISPSQDMSSYPPKGKLREPFKNIDRADAVVFTKTTPSLSLKQEIEKLNIPIYNAVFNFSISKSVEINDNHHFLVFCGIGNPAFFFKSLSSLGVHIKHSLTFQDHQNYSDRIISLIINKMKKNNIRKFITTKKDWVKLPKYLLTKYDGCFLDMSVKASRDNMGDLDFKKFILKSIKK